MIVKFPTLAMRPNVLKAGISIEGDVHHFDHVQHVVFGAIRITVTPGFFDDKGVWFPDPSGKVGRHIVRAIDPTNEGPGDECFYNVPACWKHTMEALMDTRFNCYYVPRNDETGEIKERFETGDDYEWVCG